MLCWPTASVEVVKVACPPLVVPVPRGVAPSLNVTISPLGMAAPLLLVTVAVKVTGCPPNDGFTDEVRVVVVKFVTVLVATPVLWRHRDRA